MHVLKLKLVQAETTLPEVLDEMARARQPAVLVAHEEKPLIVTAGDITAAINAAVEAHVDPATVTVGTVLPRLVPTPVPSAARNALMEHEAAFHEMNMAAMEAMRSSFDEHDRRYAVLDMTGQHAQIMTPSKSYAAALGSRFTLCKCAGPAPRIHSFTPDQLTTPGTCNFPHNAPVTCGTAGDYP